MSDEEILPTVDYPPEIRGSLRLILQLKDAFLGSFNLVEEYRDLLIGCQYGYTRNLVVFQLTKGLEIIHQLRDNVRYTARMAQGRAMKNKWLRDFLMERYNNPDATDRTGAPLAIAARIGPDTSIDEGTGEPSGSSIPAPVPVPDQVEQALHGGLEAFGSDVDVDNLRVPEEIDLNTITTASGQNLQPVVEFYKRLYFLQMHFQLLMCQAANYAMPVVTQPMTISERTFNWPAVPSFLNGAAGGSMRDRLLEIHSDVRAVATRLHECLSVVRQRISQSRRIEAYFRQQIAAQHAMRVTLLRHSQAQRTYMQSLESQNDRLVGLATKLDPDFAKSPEFSMMSGPGYGFSRWPPDSLNSAMPTSQFHPQRTDTNESGDRDPSNRRHPDQDGKGGYRRPTNHSQSRDSMDGSGKHSNDQRRTKSHQSHSNGSVSRSHDRSSQYSDGNELHLPEHDMNTSASVGGDAAVWVRHGKHTQAGSEKLNDRQMPEKDHLIHQLGNLRGQSQIVEELLIGVDSVASGKPTLEQDNRTTPSVMNTDQYVTSMHDEVFGHPSINKSSNKSISSVNAIPQYQRQTDSQHIHTPSTKYSRAETMGSLSSRRASATTVAGSPTESVKVDSSVSDRSSERSYFENANRNFPTINPQLIDSATPDMSREVDTTENTMTESMPRVGMHDPQHLTADGREDFPSPRQLNTNVNASLVTKSHHPLAKIARTTRSVPPDQRIKKAVSVAIHKCPSPCSVTNTFKKPDTGNKYDPRILQSADKTHLRQVAAVGPAECGGLCLPDWAAKRGTRAEDLLKEPKRSAFNKAVVTHRCRLVESILQADEDRLEEIVSLLLKQ